MKLPSHNVVFSLHARYWVSVTSRFHSFIAWAVSFAAFRLGGRTLNRKLCSHTASLQFASSSVISLLAQGAHLPLPLRRKEVSVRGIRIFCPNLPFFYERPRGRLTTERDRLRLHLAVWSRKIWFQCRFLTHSLAIIARNSRRECFLPAAKPATGL